MPMDSAPQNDSEKERFDEIRLIFNKEDSRGINFMHTVRNEFVDSLRKRYSGDVLDSCRLYHLVAGSSPTPEIPVTMLDLPEGEIEDFIRNKMPTLEPESFE